MTFKLIQAVAAALRKVRAQLCRLAAEGRVPEAQWPAWSTVLLAGHETIAALEQLAEAKDRTGLACTLPGRG